MHCESSDSPQKRILEGEVRWAFLLLQTNLSRLGWYPAYGVMQDTSEKNMLRTLVSKLPTVTIERADAVSPI